jgi:hypothetical protein
MTKRTQPDNDDWTRRYLRRLHVPCEGEQLKPALESLDGPAWERLKAAWRQNQCRRFGESKGGFLNALFQDLRRFGPIWERLIAWGVISETDAHLLASQPLGDGAPLKNLFGDDGACVVLKAALGCMIDDLRRQRTANPKLVNYVVAGIEKLGDPRPRSLAEFARRIDAAVLENTGKNHDLLKILGDAAQAVWEEAIRALDEDEEETPQAEKPKGPTAKKARRK